MNRIFEDREVRELNEELMRLLGARKSESLAIIDKLNRKGKRSGDNALIGYAQYRYAYYYYFTIQDLSKFRKHIQLAIHYLLRSDNKEYLGGTYNLIAYDAQDQGCYDVAYAYFMIAVQASEQQEGIPLPGLIEASAGRLLIELGDLKKGRRQQKSAIRRIRPYTDMHVYHYNMIITYADITLASFLLDDLPAVNAAMEKIEKLYNEASADETDLCRSYYLLSVIYQALLSKNDDILEDKLAELLKYWKSLSWTELYGLIFEMESLCVYMLSHDYINEVSRIFDATSPINEDENPAVVLRYYTLRVLYYEKVHDLEKLRECLHRQHEIQRRQRAETVQMIRYAMEFSDTIRMIAKERESVNEENIELRIRANTDALTGLPNRNAMTNVLQERFTLAEKEKTSFAIGIIDVDNFKQYNDVYGHQEGDRCLKRIGKVLLGFQNDSRIFCCRYGGDEFVVGYFGMKNREIDKIRESMEEQVRLKCTQKGKKEVGISQGIFNRVPDGKRKLWDYLTIADKRLYRTKKEKRIL